MRVVLLAVLFALAGCDAAGLGEFCTGNAPDCIESVGQHVCGDVGGDSARCESGQWVCPALRTGEPQIPTSECWCYALQRPQGSCACTMSGWVCDADAGADGGVDGGCAGSAPACMDNQGPHVCGGTRVGTATCVNGAWVCGGSSAPASECWCRADEPHPYDCQCTEQGWLCPSRDGGADGSEFCAGPTPACVASYGEHVCGDVGSRIATCLAGQWTCPVPDGEAPEIPTTDCWCSAMVQHDASCVCTEQGWDCPPPDAGASDDADASAGAALDGF